MPTGSDGSTARDGRSPAFCFQTIDALAVIRENFTGAKLSTALAVYLTLTEVANRKGGRAARAGFRSARSEIAEGAGITRGTLDRYVKEFEKLGLLEITREKVGDTNLPNVWVICDAPSDPPGRTGEARVAAPTRPFARELSTEVKKRTEEKSLEPEAPPPLHKVDGQNLGFNALRNVCGIAVDDGNRQGEVVAGLNGSRGVRVGIRSLVWQELVKVRFTGDVEAARAAVAKRPEDFEKAVDVMIVRRALQYKEAMEGAILTPTALAKWWLSLEDMSSGRRMSAEEMEAYGG